MKILIVKLSSLGDVVHTLPLVTDIQRYHEGALIHWVVEDEFSDIPTIHKGISKIIKVAFRRWRRTWFYAHTWRELWEFLRLLRSERYDLIIDAQGLVKSALVASIAKGPTGGFGFYSSREFVSSFLYQRRINVNKGIHAIDRLRTLGAKLLHYRFSSGADFGLFCSDQVSTKSIMLLHGTTWASKFLPEENWIRLSQLAENDGFQVLIPSGNDSDFERACRIASKGADLLPRLSLNALAKRIAGCAGIITVDTGLGHLAQALGVPTVALFGPTDPNLTGISGKYQLTLASSNLPCIPCLKRDCKFSNDDCKLYPPCFAITPEETWKTLQKQIDIKSQA
ncbi:MAG: lipopolysaccharide heptosyltransferase I [Candidatus Azotimanducaceae bacterium]|uniref:Lipopolysaccharide heptosyltransferase 1 n=1 Tax=OM182 bacterium TaxID=2510334 RepID=A0A520S5H5_9GAMM|nr:lipopolysaccharide heptosyltransferase I [Gammaproteobacteria bacterium]OUV68648.1 MAG: lipopolysaccharide heptosyltransferase I [Gammaproteobacteria bacterium TMED133]RZO77649.1 MAG: lipopolysaccharide heptosyltransferase I [OM182 bacterium]